MVGALDGLNERVGRAVAWLVLLMALNVFIVFFLRHVFAVELAWLRESYAWMHGIIFMAGAGYTVLNNGFLRVDIIYRKKDARQRAVADLTGALAFLAPFAITVAWLSWPYVAEAWTRLDGAGEIGGLPGVFLLKSVILVFCLLIGLQGAALVGRSIMVLRDQQDEPVAEGPGGK
ncbi:MAG: TRAP transporter small permease subunit [Rhodospirillales bacterium]|nr:TRAP transporter small permease subunit [Rhodospirillales bacterium]